MPYYFGAALLLWANWQVCTIIGILIGSAVPDSLPLDFAVPLVFLVLLVPAISSRPAAVAAIVGGLVALFADEAGAGHLAVLFGALGGHRRRRVRGGRRSTAGAHATTRRCRRTRASSP